MMLRRSLVDVERRALQQRLEHELVADGTGCWPWTGTINDARRTDSCFGQFYHQGKHYLAHRAAYEVWKGPIPEKMCVLLTCDNGLCCNPLHLELGTHQQNTDDMISKGRFKVGARRRIFTDEQLALIRERWATGRYSQSKIAEELNV